MKKILFLVAALFLWLVFAFNTLEYVGCDPRIATCINAQPQVSDLAFFMFILWIIAVVASIFSAFLKKRA